MIATPSGNAHQISTLSWHSKSPASTWKLRASTAVVDVCRTTSAGGEIAWPRRARSDASYQGRPMRLGVALARYTPTKVVSAGRGSLSF